MTVHDLLFSLLSTPTCNNGFQSASENVFANQASERALGIKPPHFEPPDSDKRTTELRYTIPADLWEYCECTHAIACVVGTSCAALQAIRRLSARAFGWSGATLNG